MLMLCFGKMNNALALASDWFKANKLTLHPSKTKYIFFSVGQHTELIDETLTLDGVAIEQIGLNCETKWLKILGMCLDDKLSWEGQRAHVYQKAAAGTFMLARLKRTVPHRIRLMIYNSLVRPYFEYCIEVWGCSKASDLKVFFKLQKMCVRHISGAGYRSHTDPLFASNKILKIEDLVKYKLLTLAHQAFYASRPLPPPWLICSAFQNFPIETYFLSSHSMALFLELTTQQLGFPSFGVWKTWK